MSKSQQSEPNFHVSSEFSTLTSFTVVELPKNLLKNSHRFFSHFFFWCTKLNCTVFSVPEFGFGPAFVFKVWLSVPDP